MSITLTTVILFAVFGVLLFLGVPISISIVVSSIVTAMSTLSWDQITFITMQKMNSGVESFSLLAVPLFILAGNIMNNGGIAKRLVNFAQLFVGKIPGSMAQANILGNMLFGALSGSSVAAASAMGGCISPIEEENGYDPSGFIGRIGVKNMLRKLRDANGAPAYVNGTTGGELYGQPIEFVRNGAWDNKRADIITGNFKYAVVGMRAGINYEILTEATLQGTLDSDGKPLSLAEQDMVAIKATMRLGFLVVKDDAFAAFKNGVPTLGELTVESVAGTTGNTVITVSPKPIGGHKLVYKTVASTAPSVAYDDDLSKWTEFNNGDEITATNGHKITVAEVTADGKARKSGSADVVSGE